MKVQTLLANGVRRNEDHLYYWSDTFAVFDGASSLVPYTDENENTGWYLASKIGYDTFEENPRLSLEELFQITNQRISIAMQQAGIDTSKKESIWCTTAAAVKIEEERIKYAQITDAIILAIKNDWTYQILGENSDHDRETMKLWKSLGNTPQIEKRKLVNSKIIEERKKQNISYGVLSWEEEYKNFVNLWEIARKDVDHILLFTDGLIPPKENPESPDDYSQLVTQYLQWGLSKAYSWLRKIEESDPECILYPRFKTHDDVAAIALSL